MFNIRKVYIFIFFILLFLVFIYILFSFFPTKNSHSSSSQSQGNVTIEQKTATSSIVELTEQKMQAVMQQDQKPGGGITKEGLEKIENLLNIIAEENKKTATTTEKVIVGSAEERNLLENQLNKNAKKNVNK